MLDSTASPQNSHPSTTSEHGLIWKKSDEVASRMRSFQVHVCVLKETHREGVGRLEVAATA